MRTLTTAIDEGEHKVPEGHKVTRYALAPGPAMILEPDVRRGVINVAPAEAKRSVYTYCLSWLDGRVVAEFKVDGLTVAQPIKDDPKPKRRRGDADEDDREEVEGRPAADQTGAGGRRAAVPTLRAPARLLGKLPLPEPDEEEGPAGPPEAGKRRPRRQRRPLSLRPLKL